MFCNLLLVFPTVQDAQVLKVLRNSFLYENNSLCFTFILQHICQFFVHFFEFLTFFSQVSKLGFGCMTLTGAYNSPLSEEDGIAVIKHAFSKGITFFDSADIYGPHINEILLGKVINTNFNSTSSRS